MEREQVKIAARYTARGFTVVRYMTRLAYPRNGNRHNPTKEWSYSLYQHGRLVGGGYSTLSAARELIGFILDESPVED